MKSLVQYVKFNNWEKLEENIQAVTELNYSTLVITAVVYHNKECFDILMLNPNKTKWLNNRRGHWKQKKIFENYYYGPNKLNEYFLLKVLELYEYTETENLKFLLGNKNIFHLFFCKIVKTVQSIRSVFKIICSSDDVDAFLLVHKYMEDNKQTYPFYTTSYILNNLFLICIESGSIEIIKKLYQMGFNLSKIKYFNQEVSSVIFALRCGIYTNGIFEFLYEKYPNPTENFMWCNYLLRYSFSETTDYFLKLSFNWEPTVDYNKIIEDYKEDYPYDNPNEVFVQLTTNNLIFNIQTLINEIEDNKYELSDECSVLFSAFNYLTSLIPKYPNLFEQLKTMMLLPGIDLLKISCYNLQSEIESIKYDKRQITWRRSSRLGTNSFRKHLIKTRIRKLENIYNIIKFLKTNKMSEYNVLQIEYFESHITYGKQYLKVILSYLINLGFVVTEQFKKQIIEKVFTKVELKSLDKTIKNLNPLKFSSSINEIAKTCIIKKKLRIRKSKKRVLPMDENPNNELILNNQDFQLGQLVQGDYESDSDTEDEIIV